MLVEKPKMYTRHQQLQNVKGVVMIVLWVQLEESPNGQTKEKFSAYAYGGTSLNLSIKFYAAVQA